MHTTRNTGAFMTKEVYSKSKKKKKVKKGKKSKTKGTYLRA